MVYWYSTPDDAKPSIGTWSSRIEWCEKNCRGTWKYKGKGSFHFYDKEDYTLFLLRWA